jgi:carboxyl-terminal processing protease
MPGPDALIGPQQDGIRGRLRIAGALLRARGARVGGARQHPPDSYTASTGRRLVPRHDTFGPGRTTGRPPRATIGGPRFGCSREDAMTMRRWLGPVAVLIVSLTTGGWLLQQAGARTSTSEQARLFEQVMRHVAENFVDTTSVAGLYDKAIDGMLGELRDPYTSLLRPSEYEALRVQTQGDYGGVGAQISRRGDWLTVIAPMPETPAERAGMRAGDQITEIAGESTAGWSTGDAVARLRGPAGTPVHLRLRRPGVDRPIEVHLVREEIRIRAVPSAFMMDDGVGYVELNAFTPTSTSELRSALDRLTAAGAHGVILDLRRNPGGLLEQGIAVADVFLGEGQLIAETRGRAPGQSQRASARGRDAYPDLAVVVLVGPGSASAAEIVAGALQDHDRALVMGRTSWGKGLVQALYPLPNNHWLKMTTARWYTPSGRSIEPRFLSAGERIAALSGEPEGDEPTRAAATAEARPEYRTAAGRLVYGGGGIHPDLVVEADTFLTAERAFAEAMLQERVGDYFTARLDFAVAFVRNNPELLTDFAVTPSMLDDFYHKLNASIATDRAMYDAAARWIALELATEIAYSRWGEEERRRRQHVYDATVTKATVLLAGARSTRELFELAGFHASGAGVQQGMKQAAVRRAQPQQMTPAIF